MKLLFLNRYYWPDVAATAQQLDDLATQLGASGHEVTVLCSAGRYGGEGEPLPRDEEHDGVKVHRLRSLRGRRGSFVRRLLDDLAFHLQAAWWLLREGRDARVLVALTDPPGLALHGLLLRLLTRSRVRLVVWSMDILSDAAQALGVLPPGSRRARLAAAAELAGLRRADAVVALGPCMARRLEEHGVRRERIHVIGVWADGEEVRASPPHVGGLREELGLGDRFVVMYSGNAGRVHDFESSCEAMRRLASDERVLFLFSGGGPRLPELQAFAAREGLANVRFLPYFPRERLGEALGLAGAHLVTLRRGLEGVVVPCKLYGALAAARPVLVVAPGASTIAREVQAAGAGFWHAPEDAEGLVASIRRLSREPGLAEAMGRRGRAFFEQEHEKEVCTRRWQALLALTAGPRRPC